MVLGGGSQESMGLTTTAIESFFGMRSLVCVVGGTACGVLEETSTSLGFPSERSGDSSIGSAIADFSALIFELDLVDLPLAGGDFTWSNGRAWSRLDRFIISPSWEANFHNLCQKRLPRFCSDHFPLLSDCGSLHERQRYFKFENMWLKVNGFTDKVRSWWSSYKFSGTRCFVLARKLKALKNDLRNWNMEVFGNINDQRNILFQELQCFDEKEVDGTLSAEQSQEHCGSRQRNKRTTQ
ncbi:uncharacterized protein LOC121260128 [Juglans microcarpa x Juglans regia]|uniref:uncharacterized protein LOC121260128 n=1 Tax=Juglans microcarpa x Juglans regia TaxID=2249226 RepID=UPI001B7E1602|nr:uncharacterized protein LOC121260128 [Juglans microcarpa x Juglans regia]